MRNPTRSLARAQSAARNETSSKHDAGADSRRRRFLLALGAGGAGAVAVGAGAGAPAAIACSDPPPPSDDTVARYTETDHVRDYYRTTRI